MEPDSTSQLVETSWPSLITALLAGTDLDRGHTSWVMNEVMAGAANPIALAGFLVALAAKGETVAELRGLADTMVAHAVPVRIPPGPDGTLVRTVDIVGTGGDRHRSVNISTMASLVVAGAGIPVAKHGNRAASSASGSADVLEALGVKLDLTAERAGALVNEVGISFLFAQQFHPAFRHAAAARVGLGIPTAFNVLGPITNPAQPQSGAIGVGNARMAPLIAGVFAERGHNALVFRNDDGLDELASTGPARVWEVSAATGGGVVEHHINLASELGMPPATIADLRGADPAFNAQVARDLLAGKTGAVRDVVLLNAAAGIVADGRLLSEASTGSLVDRFRTGVTIAAESIDSGAAANVLEVWARNSQR